MKVLTYTSYRGHCDLYTKIHGSTAVNSCQIGLAQKDIMLLSKASLIVYKVGKRTGIKNTDYISLTLSEGTFLINDFNTKIKITILQQRQRWEPPQIKDLTLVIPEDYLFMADNTVFMPLVYKTTILKRLPSSDQSYPLVLMKHPLIHHLLQTFCYCTVSKSAKSKMNYMGSHQVFWSLCMFLIIMQLFPQSI